MERNTEHLLKQNKDMLDESVKQAEWMLDNYTLRKLPLRHKQYFMLHRYFDEIEKDYGKLMAVLALSLVRNMTSFSNHGDYFALLELLNLTKAMADAGHSHSAKRLYGWAKDWTEEYKDASVYENLAFAVKEMERYLFPQEGQDFSAETKKEEV